MNSFISLGGGNEIGASCHIVQCEGYNFILDAGMRYISKRRYPSFSKMFSSIDGLDSPDDIDGIFLSHAHYDHNAGLPVLVSKIISSNKKIVCTEYTKQFTEIQLEDIRKHGNSENLSKQEEINIINALERLKVYKTDERIEKKGYSFTLYRSGHILGAVMTLIEVGEKKILYTGDFSDKDYPLVERYSLPDIEDLDLLIVNATNILKKEGVWENTWGNVEGTVKKDLMKEIFLNKKINLEVTTVNSGLELAILINDLIEDSDFRRLNITIVVDEAIYKMIDVVQNTNKKIFSSIKVLNKENEDKGNTIYITSKQEKSLKNIKKLQLKYSLHESYEGIKELILKLKAKKTLITHYQDNKESTLIKELTENGYIDCEFVVNEKLYRY